VSALETVDLAGVEILSTGGPVHGKGSPPGGDYWTSGQLRGIADANRALAAEVRAPAKIGHGSDQPAVGWLDNIRISGDGSKLLADVRRVPRKFADLIDAGAYRSRSVELSKVTSQRTGRTYDWVVSGLAWLGGKLPAVRTLDDVVALYHGGSVELRRAYSLDNGHRKETAMTPAAIEAMLGHALESGRIEYAERDTFKFALEMAPAVALRDLARRPADRQVAEANFFHVPAADADFNRSYRLTYGTPDPAVDIPSTVAVTTTVDAMQAKRLVAEAIANGLLAESERSSMESRFASLGLEKAQALLDEREAAQFAQLYGRRPENMGSGYGD
jgi:hypothetical protein